MALCDDCGGTRSVPDIFGDPGPCPSCVIVSEDGRSWVVLEDDLAEPRGSSVP